MCMPANTPHGSPGIKCNLEYYDGNAESDQRVGERQSHGDEYGGRDYCQAHVGVGAGVITVRYQRNALKSPSGARADSGSSPIANKTEQSASGQC